ncbi:MAG: hypothetical protein JOZ08_03560 [Verrucomicrobia bacterium]|nr:hypothetical protein [Verrucomicrobiota bacterium]
MKPFIFVSLKALTVAPVALHGNCPFHTLFWPSINTKPLQEFAGENLTRHAVTLSAMPAAIRRAILQREEPLRKRN